MSSIEKNEKRETLADIAAYMRVLLNYAERIEAIDSADAWRSLYTPPVVNAAAMREALVSFMQLADYGVIQPRSVGEDDEYCFCVLKKMVRASLSVPARNCDRYKDAPSAYADFIVPWKLDGHLDDVPTLQDFANWLLAPAAERKGEEPCTRAMDATI